MHSLPALAAVFLAAAGMAGGVVAEEVGIAGHGLIGYGITMYQPLCAYSCRVALSASPLNCSNVMEIHGMTMADTSPECYANDNVFLTSFAWCIHARCADLSIWEIEKYWQSTEASIRNSHRRLDEPSVNVNAYPPAPKWTYQEALSNVNGTPTATVVFAMPLKEKSLVSDADYQVQYNTMGMFEKMEVAHERYGLILIALGAAVPVFFSLLRFIPLPKLLISKINALFIDPPLLGRRHKAPYFNLLVMPTRGQAILIFYMVAVNVVLSGVGYDSAQPNAWWVNNKDQELLTSFSNRMGVLSFANLPLLILYAGRNNFLYWVTDWTQSTFMLLHRWTAYFCTLQACLHSAAWLQIYVSMGQHDIEAKLPYWVWGIIGTLAMSILLPASVIPFRAKLYELFLAVHVVLAVFAVVGSYLHIVYRFQNQWGYEIWIVKPASAKSMDNSIMPPQSSGNSYSKESSVMEVAAVKEKSRVGLSFLVRSFTGATGLLRSHTRVPVFVEAGYLPHHDLSKYQKLVCIIGGVAITAVAPVLQTYPGNAKLYWSSRTEGLVQSVDLKGVHANVSVGNRFRLRAVLEEEVGNADGSLAVVVSGPAPMVDEARCIVSELALRAPIPITFIDETYIW
ncbi:ferric reductase transmembrane component 4 [Colletotrichum nymphaeae SA-01]|uniref:Ferric reductase transmembrane component 4 n=1 Tax=Colletotrichum nymphaeae SA-01 TaxID=1460502 RepID=A0A135TG10_9PEZI|nr:ferric reductase transmembrane component 4 [Colletotrichum nymphaeae SA-01]